MVRVWDMFVASVAIGVGAVAVEKDAGSETLLLVGRRLYFARVLRMRGRRRVRAGALA